MIGEATCSGKALGWRVYASIPAVETNLAAARERMAAGLGV